MHFMSLRADLLKVENPQFEDITLLDQKKTINNIIKRAASQIIFTIS